MQLCYKVTLDNSMFYAPLTVDDDAVKKVVEINLLVVWWFPSILLSYLPLRITNKEKKEYVINHVSMFASHPNSGFLNNKCGQVLSAFVILFENRTIFIHNFFVTLSIRFAYC